jgi:hypothetical protein
MKNYSVLLGLTLLASCRQETPAPTGLAGEWHVQKYDLSSYSATGTLLSRLVSPGGETENIIITDSTVAYFSDMSVGPGPPTPGRWVTRKYTRLGDTLRYDQWRYALIRTLTSTSLTLYTSSKQAIPAYYQESDVYYTRVR